MSTLAPVLPFVPGVIRAWLADKAQFTTLVPAGRIVTRAPVDVTAPFCLVRSAPALAIEPSAGVWAPLVQVEGFAPPGGATDP
jgi:hypothetical protein